MAHEPISAIFATAAKHHQEGRLADAERGYRAVLDANPAHDNALHLLGLVLFHRGERPQGIQLVRQAIALNSTDAAYFLNLGSMLGESGQLEEATASLLRAVSLSPNNAQAHFNLGRVFEMRGAHADAAHHYRRAIELLPALASAHNNLGNVLQHAGDLEGAEQCYRRSIELRPRDAKTLANLARVLHQIGKTAEAIGYAHRAVTLEPRDPDVHNNLGTILAGQRQYDQAIECYRAALRFDPQNAMALTNLGNALKEVGELNEAITHFRRSLGTVDDCRTAGCLNIAIHMHPDYSPERIREEHDRWEERFARRLRPEAHNYENLGEPDRRLRIGYVSPQLGDQIVGHCVCQLLEHHDHSAFEIFCYSDTRKEDWMSDRLRTSADNWRRTMRYSDEQLAEAIRNDRIDVLVDLNMHMDHSRLLVFARKPAPVQVTWIGYPSTTGLRSIDYRLSDPYLDPIEAGAREDRRQAFYSESTIRLPKCFWCYQPLDQLPPPNPLPALSSGQITFGCLNSFYKITDMTIRLWANVLRAITASRMLILAPSGSARDRLLKRFSIEGVDPDRIGFLDRRPRRSYMELFHQIDVGLDTFPYSGHTTTLDSLWMGVPVISLVGGTAVSRGGLSILSNIGLADFATDSPAEFVNRAKRVAEDLPSLGQLRASLRSRMAESPLTDGGQFARDVENIYREVWARWCRAAGKQCP